MAWWVLTSLIALRANIALRADIGAAGRCAAHWSCDPKLAASVITGRNAVSWILAITEDLGCSFDALFVYRRHVLASVWFRTCRLGWFRDGSWCYSSSATSSEGWLCWKGLKRLFCGDIGLVVLSGLGSCRTHPVGVEGTTMARRVPFPPSSIPAYIEQSMKLFVCLSAMQSRCRVKERHRGIHNQIVGCE